LFDIYIYHRRLDTIDILLCFLFDSTLALHNNNSYKPITNTRGFAPGFVNCKKECTRLAAASDKVYQLLAHGRWFSPGTSASSSTKTCRHDIAEILLKVALNTKNQIKSTLNKNLSYLSME
jgi:hypothetical protein